MTQYPGKAAVPQFASQVRGRHGQDRALGVGQAVPGHFGNAIQPEALRRPAPTSSTSAGWQARLTSTHPAGPRSTWGSTIGSLGRR